MSYSRTGTGTPVLLIQGVGAIGNAWRPQIEGLRDRFSLIAFDNRGIGASTSEEGTLTVEAMADDFRWTISGNGRWSHSYQGKQAVLTELFPALRERIEGRIKMIPQRILGDGEHVVVEARGDNITKAGQRYDNSYCFVFRVAGGKLAEVTEYMDTELVTAALGSDPRTAAAQR